jgi:MFS family permease
MTGPTIGGFLLQLGGWQSIFWMNFIVGLVVSAAVVKIFRGAGERRVEPFDLWGSLALLTGYPALLIGLTLAPNHGWASLPVAGWFALAAGGLASFFWIELYAENPLIDVALFKRKMLSQALAAVVLSHMIYNPVALCAPLFLQNALRASPLTAGLALAVLPLSTALASPLSGRLADRLDPTKVALLGLALIVAGIAFYSRLGESSILVTVVAALALLGIGVGVFTPANQKVAFASVGQEDYGVLAAMLSSFGTAAGTVGTAMVVALMEASAGQRLWGDATALAEAQGFAFTCLLPLGALGVVLAMRPGVAVGARLRRNA